METSTADDVVEVQLDLTVQDYVRFNWWHVLHRTGMRVMLGVSLLAVAYFSLLGLAESGRQRVGDFFVVGVALCYWTAIALTIAIGARKVFATHSAAQESHRLIAAAGGISSASASTTAQQTWGTFWKAVETKGAFYLFISGVQALVLPKRCFTSEEQMQRFREIVRAGMGERAKGIRG